MYRALRSFCEGIGLKLAEGVRRRQDRFEHPDDFAARLRRSPSFERLRPGVADLFAHATLRPAGTGYVLRCPPTYEAQIYEYFWGWTTRVDFDSLPCPVKVVGADPTVPFSCVPSLDLSALGKTGDVVELVSARKPLYRSFPVTIHHTFRASCSPISSRKMPAIGLGGVIGGGPAPIFGTRP